MSHYLDHNHITITLPDEAASILREHGERAFIVIGRGTYPDHQGKWLLYLIPATIDAANAAVRVARGISKERRIKQPESAPAVHVAQASIEA